MIGASASNEARTETNQLFKLDLFLLGFFRRFQEGQKLAHAHTCTSSDQAQSLVEMLGSLEGRSCRFDGPVAGWAQFVTP